MDCSQFLSIPRLHTLLPPQTIHTLPLPRNTLRPPVWLLFILMSSLRRRIHIACLLPVPIVLMSTASSLRPRLKSSTKLRLLASAQLLPVVTAGDGRYVGIDWILLYQMALRMVARLTDALLGIRFDAQVLRVRRMAVAATVFASTRSACSRLSLPRRKLSFRPTLPILTCEMRNIKDVLHMG